MQSAATARGSAEAEGERYRLAKALLDERVDGGRRQAAELKREVQAARATLPHLQGRITELESKVQEQADELRQLSSHIHVKRLMVGGRTPVRIHVLLRRLVLIGKVPQRNVPAVLDIAFTILTGEVTKPEYQISDRLVRQAFVKLDVIRRQRTAVRNAADPAPWSGNSDTGNKKDCEREVIAVGQIDVLPDGSGQPVARAVSCTDISHDQSGRNGADVLFRQFTLAGLRPETCAGLIGDSTGHAVTQREGTADRLAEKGARREFIIIAGCVRHFKELELKAAFEGGWPGKQAESFLYAFRDMLHKNTPFWRKVWLRAMQPANVFDRCIARMPVPTASKWECMDEVCRLFLQTYEVDESMRGFGVTMIEEFVKYARGILRGHGDAARPQDAGKHGDKEKFHVLAKDLQRMQLLGAIYAVLDLAQTNSSAFHYWCKQKCPLYGWSNDFKAHLMAVKACEEADFWERATANPAVAFPLTASFMKRNVMRAETLMTAQVRCEIAASMTLAIEKGKAKNEEWMLTQYTAAPFLFGAACDERHRLGAAQLILRAAGHGQRLDAAMAAASVTPVTESTSSQRLFACLKREAANGELRRWWRQWSMDPHLGEWLRLATAPPQPYGNPLLCHEQTPGVHKALWPLFVLIVHNTRLESYVSKHKQLEQSNMGSRLVDAMFMAHCEMEPEREVLSSSQLRATSGGAKRTRAQEEAAKGKPITGGAYRSKLQRIAMTGLGLKEAGTFTDCEFYQRKGSVAAQVQEARASDAAVADAVNERKVVTFVKTASVTEKGNPRKAVAPPAACHKAPELAKAGEHVPAQRGTGRSAADLAVRSKAATAAKAAAPPVTKTARPRKDGQPMTQAQQRTHGQPLAKPKKRKPSAEELEVEAAAKRQRLAVLQAEEAVRAQAAEVRRVALEERRAREAQEAAAAAAIAAETQARECERLKLKAELQAVMTQAGRVLKQRDWDAMGPEWSAKVARYKQLKAAQTERDLVCP